ncbi:MAG: FeoB-associated Cys-rich membrane protein [Armatimonadetes bacterium]|nr:FeoB-associated Cys-rich membrane protein [Armatimonadota bacterium]
MTADLQNILALTLVALAAGWLVWRGTRKKGAGGCGCGCDGCTGSKRSESSASSEEKGCYIPLDDLNS